MAIQLAPWMLKAGLALGKAGLGYLEGRKKQKQLDNLSKITPAERDYVKRQREIADSGDPRLANALNKQTSTLALSPFFCYQRSALSLKPGSKLLPRPYPSFRAAIQNAAPKRRWQLSER